MGFFRIFYIIKSCIKSVLYKLPKKWLIMIIFALLMTFGLTKVKGASYIDSADINTNNLTFYEYLDIKNNYFDTGINPSVGTSSAHNNRAIYIEYLQSAQRYSVAFNINEDMNNNNLPYNSSESGIELQQQYDPSQSWFRVNRNWNSQSIFNLSNNTKHELHLNFIDNYASIDGHMYNFGSYINDFYTSHTLYLNSNPSYLATTFRVYYMEVDELINNGQDVSVLHKYYASKYIDTTNPLTTTTYNGFYDTITGDFLIFVTGSSATFGNETESPIVPPTEPSGDTDYTQNLEDINSSINETNDFLQDTNVDSSSTQMPSANVSNQSLINSVDSSFTDFFSDYRTKFINSQSVDISLYIPNMSNGQILSTITINSNYVRDKLRNINLIVPNGLTMLGLIELVWYVVFGFWFLFFVVFLVTTTFSGKIIEEEGITALTEQYTGIAKKML